MAQQPLGPRKQRTREHVIADLSRNHVERFILEEGYSLLRYESDYGYDLLLVTHDEQGYVEPGDVRLQLKGAEQLKQVGSDYVFDLDVRDYQRYFAEDEARRPKKGAKTIRVRIPNQQKVTRRAIRAMRGFKQAALGQV